MFQNHNGIRVTNRRQPVSNHKDGTACHQGIHALLDKCLSTRINTGSTSSLGGSLMAARAIAKAASDLGRLAPSGKPRCCNHGPYGRMRAYLRLRFCCSNNFRHQWRLTPKRNIICDGTVNRCVQQCPGRQCRLLDVDDRNAVTSDGSATNIVEAVSRLVMVVYLAQLSRQMRLLARFYRQAGWGCKNCLIIVVVTSSKRTSPAARGFSRQMV